MADSPLGWHVTGLPGAHELVAQGCSARQIADALNLSELTIKRWAWRNRIELPKYVHSVKPDQARMVELAEAGMTATEIANEVGYSYCGVRAVLKRFGITAARKPQLTGPRHMERAEKMVSMYRQGLTLAVIGEHFGVTRERVRQIIKAMGVEVTEGGIRKRASVKAAESAAKLDARCRLKYGLPHDEMRKYRADGTVQAFRYQRNSAKARGIEWRLSFGQWLRVWLDSGKLAERGRGKGRYCMSRIKDSGGYVMGNVHIQSNSENGAEAVKKWIGKTKANRGVFYLYPGLSTPWFAKVGKQSLGLFATEAEAVAAREAYLQATPSPQRKALELKAA